MPLRDIALTLFILGCLPYIFRRPYLGILLWSWISYMNPHRLTWGFAYDMPFAQIVAITLLLSLLFGKEKLRIPFIPLVAIWVVFVVWMLISTIFAIYPDAAFTQYIKVVKIQLVTFLTLMLITDQKKINQLIWVIVLSIGYYSTKGGLFTLLTGGVSRVWGPPGGFIQENNSLALATLMIIPLMIYLYRLHRANTYIKLGLGAAILLSTASVLGSQSRGALVAIIAVAGFFWLKSKGKFISAIAIVLAAFALYSFMPESWHERMSSIRNYEEDRSAMGRLNAWQYSINVANDRITGAGFESWKPGPFSIWAPDPDSVHAAHSIFFGVLGDHGWPGLLLFIMILILTWLSLGRSIRKTKVRADLSEENLLARMLHVCLIAYMSGGAFLSLAYFDLPWHLIAIAILLSRNIDSKLSKNVMNPQKLHAVYAKTRKVEPSESKSFKATG